MLFLIHFVFLYIYQRSQNNNIVVVFKVLKYFINNSLTSIQKKVSLSSYFSYVGLLIHNKNIILL